MRARGRDRESRYVKLTEKRGIHIQRETVKEREREVKVKEKKGTHTQRESGRTPIKRRLI